MEYCKLGKLVELKQGLAINSHTNHLVCDYDTGLALLRIADMPTKKRVVFMDEKTPDRYIASEDDIIYTRTGQVGLVFTGQKGVVHNNCFRVIPIDEQILSRKYLFWALSLPEIYSMANIYAAGSAQPDLPHTSFKKIKIPIYALPIQDKIASILSAYDNLIENNNRRIRLLEQMAENLYKEWFVRFRFPGHEKVEYVNSKLGKIPSLFIATTMNEVFEDYIGGGWGNDEKTEDFPVSASVIRGADFPNVWHYDLSTCPKRYHKISNYKSRQLQDGDIVLEISGGTSEQPVGRTVLITQDMINRFEEGKVICASFCKLVRLKKDKISPFYFYYWMHFLYDTRIIDRYQLQSTGIINFKFEAFLKKGILMLPPKDLMLSFEKQMVPLFKEMNQLAMQNQLLTRQRDLLLPRLMSGKLEVNA